MRRKSNSWSTFLRFWLLIAWISPGPVNLAIAAGAPYGEHFVRAGKSWQETVPPRAAAAVELSAALAADYHVAIIDFEQQSGPYADRLAEPVAALARQYRAAGDFDSARRFYQRALHLVRINDGLYSQRQVPLLRELLHTYREQGDYESLDERYDYYFHLYGNGQAPHTELRLRAALEYLRWQREALRLEIGGRELGRLLQAYQLNQRLLDATGDDSAVSFEQRRALVMSQMSNLYLLQDRGPTGQHPSAPGRGSDPMLTQPLDVSVTEQKLQNLKRGAQGLGEDLLESMLPAARNVGPVEEARVQLALGDWLQWYGNSARAGTFYLKVEELLHSAGEDALLEQWLAAPVELPDNGAFWQPATSSELPYIHVRFDVTERGRVRNVATERAEPELENEASALRRRLLRTRFRPRWEAGQAQATAGLQRDYQILD